MTQRTATINGEECIAVPSTRCHTVIDNTLQCAAFDLPDCKQYKCTQHTTIINQGVVFLTKSDYVKWVAIRLKS